MSSDHRKKGEHENGGNYLGSNDFEGSSARTRGFSYEQVMLRRKNKKLAENANEETVSPKSLPEKDDSRNLHGNKGSDGGNDLQKDSKYSTRGHRTKGVLFNKKTSPSKHRDKVFDDLKTSTKEKIKVLSVHEKADMDREVNRQSDNIHRNRTDDLSKAKSEKERGRRLFKDTRVKGRQEAEHGERLRDDKKKKLPVSNEKSRRYMEIFSAKRYDHGHRLEREPLDRRKIQRYEEQSSKRRRSRSWEFERGRGRSPSLSPKGKKQSFHRRDHGEPSNHNDKYSAGGQHSDSGKYRTLGSGRHQSARYRRHESGLGGYSPRKRKPEAAAPIILSPPPSLLPEKKEAKWDLPPVVNNTSSLSLSGNLQLPLQSTYDQPSSTLDPSTHVKSQGASFTVAPAVSFASIDSVHLTQATRSMRRLYMENLPPLASDKSMLSFLNDFLLEAGANHIPGSQPCISCIINKEKGQAVVEFLTPEDATAALSFDGRSMSGTVLKFRRPKDFVDATPSTGVQEKPAAVLNQIADIVYDSPHKIFIGGVSDFLSSDELLAIVSTFGAVKAFHFEFNQELNQSCAFLEYVDHSITQKACSGLDGLKLGGNIITVVRALLDANVAEENPRTASYSIPEHARQLLESPTPVLKLKNLLDQESFSQLSEVDLEEILEDVRLECARFGTIKSTNVARAINSQKVKVNELVDLKSEADDQQQPPPDSAGGHVELEDLPHLETGSEEPVNTDGGNDVESRRTTMEDMVSKDLPKVDSIVEENPNQMVPTGSNDQDLEPGCVLVEFLRKEAACTAAHVLNGRLFDGRAVTVAYVPHEVYLAHFPM